jgi:hypothetical protein
VTWVEEDKFVAWPDPAAGDRFGYSVSITDDRAVVGAYCDDDSGSAYVFHYEWDEWVRKAKLTASDAAAGDEFGYSVSIIKYIGGERVLVGAHYDDEACPKDPDCDSGSAYLFDYDGTQWAQMAKLTPSDGAAGDHFGTSVSVYTGDLAVVGAPGGDGAEADTGSAYIFEVVDADSNGIPDACGACCRARGCVQVTQEACGTIGEYRGDGTICEEQDCAPIPTVSEWGLVAMTLLMLAAGSMVLIRRRAVTR